MPDLLFPAVLLVLGAGVVGLGMRGRGRTPRMDAAEEKMTKLKEVIQRAKERIAALRKERREIIARHHKEIDRLKKEQVSRDIEAL